MWHISRVRGISPYSRGRNLSHTRVTTKHVTPDIPLANPSTSNLYLGDPRTFDIRKTDFSQCFYYIVTASIYSRRITNRGKKTV